MTAKPIILFMFPLDIPLWSNRPFRCMASWMAIGAWLWHNYIILMHLLIARQLEELRNIWFVKKHIIIRNQDIELFAHLLVYRVCKRRCWFTAMSFTSAVQVVIGLVTILLARIRIGHFCCHFATMKAISMAHSCWVRRLSLCYLLMNLQM